MIPPRNGNDNKDGTIIHRHTNINGPRDDEPPIMLDVAVRKTLLDAISDTLLKAGLFCFAIGLLIGMILGWGLR